MNDLNNVYRVILGQKFIFYVAISLQAPRNCHVVRFCISTIDRVIQQDQLIKFMTYNYCCTAEIMQDFHIF